MHRYKSCFRRGGQTATTPLQATAKIWRPAWELPVRCVEGNRPSHQLMLASSEICWFSRECELSSTSEQLFTVPFTCEKHSCCRFTSWRDRWCWLLPLNCSSGRLSEDLHYETCSGWIVFCHFEGLSTSGAEKYCVSLSILLSVVVFLPYFLLPPVFVNHFSPRSLPHLSLSFTSPHPPVFLHWSPPAVVAVVAFLEGRLMGWGDIFVVPDRHNKK